MASESFPNLPPGWTYTGATPSPVASYANAVQLAFSPWDFTLHFYVVTPALDPQASGEQEVQVSHQLVERLVMSPMHAKALLKALTENVERYEEQYAPIPDIAPDTGLDAGDHSSSDPGSAPPQTDS